MSNTSSNSTDNSTSYSLPYGYCEDGSPAPLYYQTSGDITGVMQLVLMVLWNVVSLANFILTCLYYKTMGVNKIHSRMFIVGAVCLCLSNIGYLPASISFMAPCDSWLRSSSNEVMNFEVSFGIIADFCYTSAFAIYQGTMMYRFYCLTLGMDKSKYGFVWKMFFHQRVYFGVAILSAVVYALGLLIFFPYNSWCFAVSCPDQYGGWNESYWFYNVYENVLSVIFSLVDICLGTQTMLFVSENLKQLRGKRGLFATDRKTALFISFLGAWGLCCVLNLVSVFIMAGMGENGDQQSNVPTIMNMFAVLFANLEILVSSAFVIFLKDWLQQSHNSSSGRMVAVKHAKQKMSDQVPMTTLPSSKKESSGQQYGYTDNHNNNNVDHMSSLLPVGKGKDYNSSFTDSERNPHFY